MPNAKLYARGCSEDRAHTRDPCFRLFAARRRRSGTTRQPARSKMCPVSGNDTGMTTVSSIASTSAAAGATSITRAFPNDPRSTQPRFASSVSLPRYVQADLRCKQLCISTDRTAYPSGASSHANCAMPESLLRADLPTNSVEPMRASSPASDSGFRRASSYRQSLCCTRSRIPGFAGNPPALPPRAPLRRN